MIEQPPFRFAVGTGGQLPDAGLARDLTDLARQLQAERSRHAVLERITAAAINEIPGAAYAGISEINGRRVDTRAATHPLVGSLDEVQHRASDGPCITSLRDEVTVRSEDLATDGRWPTFGPAAVERGVRSSLSVQLFVQAKNLGALNIYSPHVSAFDDAAESIAMLLAAHAAIAMTGNAAVANLTTALASRDVIGQAKGILMERFKIDQTEAFDLLVLASQRSHRKLREVAESLTLTGDLVLPGS